LTASSGGARSLNVRDDRLASEFHSKPKQRAHVAGGRLRILGRRGGIGGLPPATEDKPNLPGEANAR
jgi:hypothetical protein